MDRDGGPAQPWEHTLDYRQTVVSRRLATTPAGDLPLGLEVAILLTGLLTPEQPHTPRPRTPRPYDPEPEYDSYPVARRTGGSPPPAAGSLSDRLH